MIGLTFKSSALWLREALFPVFCFGCRREGYWLCPSCRLTCPPLSLQRCLACTEIHAYGQMCKKGKLRYGLTHLISRGNFYDWLWQPLIHAWKYESAAELNALIQEMFLDCASVLPKNIDLIIPVPLSYRREMDRGFNQAAVLAQGLHKHFGWPVVEAVRRIVDTPPQATLLTEQRKINMYGAFQCSDIRAVKDKNCLIVDDVVTTGATLTAMSRALLHAGAGSVSAATLLSSVSVSR